MSETRNNLRRLTASVADLGVTLPKAVVKELDATLTLPPSVEEAKARAAIAISEAATKPVEEADAIMRQVLGDVALAESAVGVRARALEIRQENVWRAIVDNSVATVAAYSKALAPEVD